MTDDETLIEKYTGARIAFGDLSAAASRGGIRTALANAIWHAATTLTYAEADLTQVASWITAATTRVTTAITAAPGQRTPTVNPLGELQSNGPRFDQLIAVREERISHLQRLVRLWSTLGATGDPDTTP